MPETDSRMPPCKPKCAPIFVLVPPPTYYENALSMPCLPPSHTPSSHNTHYIRLQVRYSARAILASSSAAPGPPGSPVRRKLLQKQHSSSGGRQQQQQLTGSSNGSNGGAMMSGCDLLRKLLCRDMGMMAELVSAQGEEEMAAVLAKQVWSGVWIGKKRWDRCGSDVATTRKM